MKVVVITNGFGVGEQIFKLVVPTILNEENLEIKFLSVEEIPRHGVKADAICVGGDLEEHFHHQVNPLLSSFVGVKIALCIGVPNPHLIKDEYLRNYDHVISNNLEDLRELQRVLGTYRAHFLPE